MLISRIRSLEKHSPLISVVQRNRMLVLWVKICAAVQCAPVCKAMSMQVCKCITVYCTVLLCVCTSKYS